MKELNFALLIVKIKLLVSSIMHPLYASFSYLQHMMLDDCPPVIQVL